MEMSLMGGTSQLPYTSRHVTTVDDLPDEVLEFILSFVPPYRDIHDCMVVCKRWRRCVLNVTKIKKRNLDRAISEFNLEWRTVVPAAMAPTITKRYSHSAAVHNNSMYVFGGCTSSMTTFNDLWRLDLSKRQWVRPLAMGTYPSPKACSTMVCYKDLLVLFGGWTYPPSYPLHQSWHLFNELHTYDITGNKWTCINTVVAPPPTAGHSVSLHKEWMVIFGGLQRPSTVVHSSKTNEVWKLNLETWNWYRQETTGAEKPLERYGQSQTVLDDDNILIMGGSGGPSIYYSDAWVLNMKGPAWKWIKVEVRNTVDAPGNLWCNPVCKVGNKIVILSRSRSSPAPSFMYISKGVWVPPRENPNEVNQNRPQHRIDQAARAVDRDDNVNGKRGTFKGLKRNNSDSSLDTKRNYENRPVVAGPSGNSKQLNVGALAAFSTDNLPSTPDPRRQMRQDKMRKAEDMFNRLRRLTTNYSKAKPNVLSMFVLDITHALDEKPYVTWMPLKDNGIYSEGPEETVLYTLVEGKAELIMFGGIQRDATTLCTTNLSNQVTNTLHFITAPAHVI